MKNCDLLLLRLAKCYFRGAFTFNIEITYYIYSKFHPNRFSCYSVIEPQTSKHLIIQTLCEFGFIILLSDVESMTWDWQQKFLDVTVNNELIKLYPLSNSFSKLFLKNLMTVLDNQEIHDEMYAHLCRFMSIHPSDNSFSYRHYVIGDNLTEIITIKEMNKLVVDGTTGLRTWEAALMLADWALCNKGKFSNKKVLELGSGVGFTGVTIAKHCCPLSIYLTDCHSKVLNTISDNININFPHIDEENNEEIMYRNNGQEIGVMILDWNAIENFSSSIVPDVIIGADIVYDPTTIQPLCDVLKTFFDRNKQLDVYIASVIRNENTFLAFLNTLDLMNFNIEKLPLNESVFIEWDQSVQKCLIHISC